MTDESLKKIIALINSGKLTGHVFVVPLAANVSIGMAWPYTLDELHEVRGYRVFSVSLPDAGCVGIVLDMYDDLHVLVLRQHRRRGAMTAALRDVVLPFLADEGRETQRLTHKPWNKAAAALVERLTTAHPLVSRAVGDTEVEVTLRLTLSGSSLHRLRSPPSTEALQRMERRLVHARNLIRAAREELAHFVDEDNRLPLDLECIGDDLFEAIDTLRLDLVRR